MWASGTGRALEYRVRGTDALQTKSARMRDQYGPAIDSRLRELQSALALAEDHDVIVPVDHELILEGEVYHDMQATLEAFESNPTILEDTFEYLTEVAGDIMKLTVKTINQMIDDRVEYLTNRIKQNPSRYYITKDGQIDGPEFKWYSNVAKEYFQAQLQYLVSELNDTQPPSPPQIQLVSQPRSIWQRIKDWASSTD